LAQLVNAELLYQRGRPPRARFFFKHALIRDAAYESLLRSTRQHYHQQIAQLFERQFPDLVETQPELVAHHYTEAGLNENAIGYWQRAGQRAVERSAHAEAVGHLNRGLEVVSTLPETPERARQELTLQTTLGPALIATKSYTAAEVERAYARARELCEDAGDTPQLFLVLRGLQVLYYRALQVGAHMVLGQTLLFLGEPISSRENLEQGWALYDMQPHGFEDWPGGHPAVQCLTQGAWAVWVLGYPDQALHRSREALTLAREVSHPLSLATAHVHAAILRQWRRDPQATLTQAEAAMTLATEQGFPYMLAAGKFFQGAALAALGRDGEGVMLMREGVAGLQATGTQLALPYLLSVSAEGFGKIGEIDEGLATLAEALRRVDRSGERWCEADLHRQKGELTLQSRVRSPVSGAQSEAEECFQKALNIASRQQAKSFELRAATSLSRLWQQQGRREEARKLLAEIYGWFTEGFGTGDLREAKALLEELSA
jgi:predicted ATPase